MSEEITYCKKTTPEVLKEIRRQLKGTLEDTQVVTWQDKVDQDIPVLVTPSPRLNAALGVGGIPRGRITEIFGPAGGGKTTLCLHLIAEAQRQGDCAAIIDVENALDASYASALGVDMDNLIISQPSTGDEALGLAKIMIQAGVGLIVVDSIAAMVSKAELEKEITDTNIGLQARMLSQGLRQLTHPISSSNCALVFTNQIRQKISFMGGETTPGGLAMQYYASVRLRIGKISKPNEDRTAQQTSKIRVAKNKVAPPFRDCEVAIVYGKGIDSLSDTVKFGKENGIIEGAGRSTKLPVLPNHQLTEENLKFSAMADVIEFLENNPEYFTDLKEYVVKKHGSS